MWMCTQAISCVQGVLDRLEEPLLQLTAADEEPSGSQSWVRPLKAATALRHRLRGNATTSSDDKALRRNELALLLCHLGRLLGASTAELRATGEHAVTRFDLNDSEVRCRPA